MLDTIRDAIGNVWFLSGWAIGAIASAAVLLGDLRTQRYHVAGMMKLVWLLTVLYSGPVGLAVYYFSGRKQIARDSVWRRGFRSVAHCYSGCGAGEVIGVILSVGLLSAGQIVAGLVTFTLAYAFGVALTAGPLLRDGEPFSQAMKDAVISESASIVVMEVVAIGVDFWIAGDATLGQPLFWASLIVSLSIGLVAAYPVNVALIHWGVKEGMHDPRVAME